MFVSADDPDTLKGSAYLFTGKWDTWTQLQQFSPPVEFTYNNFGTILDVDTASLSSAVVGCPTCNATKWAGQIYVYTPDPSNAGETALSHTWSQTQVLMTDYYDFNTHPDKVAFFLGSKVAVHGDVIVGMAQMYPYLSALTYVRNSVTGIWSYQQALRLDMSVSSFAVYEDTIVLSATSQTVNGYSEAGAAFIFYPNTNAYFVLSDVESRQSAAFPSINPGLRNGYSQPIHETDSIPLDSSSVSLKRGRGGAEINMRVNPFPKSTQWSQHQVLYAPALANTNNFGSDVSLQKNMLVVGEQGTSTVYLYRRPGVRGSSWSQVQSLNPSTTAADVEYFSRSFFHGTTLVVAGIIGTQTYLETFTSSLDWGCLVVEVMDQFGDGWGTSQLQVDTPMENTFDYFAPVCNYPNPFTFRYCPTNPEDSGSYVFSIPDGILTKYYWEMHFQIYEEKSKTWYHGDSSTVMSFQFDSTALAFSYEDGSNVLPAKASCVVCPYTEPFLSWAHLEVKMTATNGYSWFQESFQGSSYSISDSDGRRELVAGTMCDPSSSAGEVSSYSCWHVLVDGTYTFRVTGDLNDHSASGNEKMSWSFCNATGTESVHMYFKISDGNCFVLALYSLESYCNKAVNTVPTVTLSLVVSNTPFVSHVTEFVAIDRAAFSATLASFVSFMQPRDVQYLNVVSTAGDSTSGMNETTIDVQITMNTVRAGFDPLDLSSMTTMTATAVNSITSAFSTEETFFSLLKVASAYNSTFFHEISGVNLVNIAVQNDIEVIVPAQLYSYATEVNAAGDSFIPEN